MKKPALKIEQWDIERVLPYAANAKVHPGSQVLELAASITQFGFVNPILVDINGVVVAGHGRLLAADQLGMEKVPVIKLGHLTEVQAKALRLADNTLPMSGTSWNTDLLDAELASLRAVSFDLASIGLDNIDLPEIEDQVAEPPPRAQRSKTTIFLAVKNEDAVKARKAVIAALDKVKISHNL